MEDIRELYGGLVHALEQPTHDEYDGFQSMGSIYNRQSLVVDTDEDEEEELHKFLLMGGPQQSSESSSDEEEIRPRKIGRLRPLNHVDATEEGGEVDLDDEDLPEPPAWFLWQPIQHSKLLVLPLVVGSILPLIVGGDMLLGVITLGALVTYLLYEGGSTKHASTACVISTISASVMIIYNITPLVLWTSGVYLVLLIAAFTYIILTGLWVLVTMKDFCRREPDLAYYFESLLFTIYPIASIVLVTWSVTIVTAIQYAPYILLVTGFLFFRIFLRPTLSSFVNADWPDDNKKLVVDPTISTIMAGYVVIFPAMLQLIASIATGEFQTSIIGHLFECVSVLLGSAFLTTFLHVNSIISKIGVNMDTVYITRKAVAMTTIVTGTIALHFHGYQSLLLPWWPLIFVCSWAVQGVSIAKSHKFQSVVFTGNLLFLSTLLLLQMPWSIVHHVGHSLWSVQFLYLSILLNAALCIVGVYGSKFFPKDVFSLFILAQSIVFVPQVSLIYQSDQTSVIFVVLLQCFCVYVNLRMYYVSKLLYQHALLSSSLHLTVMIVSVVNSLSSMSQNWGQYVVNFFAVYMLVLLVMYIFIVEKSECLNTQKHIQYLASSMMLVILYLSSIQDTLTPLVHSGNSASVCFLVGLAGMITSIPGIKLVLWHKVETEMMKSVTVLLAVSSVTMATLQPALSSQWSDVVRLLLVLMVGGGCLLVIVVNRIRSWTGLYTLCAITGAPFGVVALFLIYPDNGDIFGAYMIGYGLQSSIVLALCVTAYKQSAKTEHHSSILGILSLITTCIMVLFDVGYHGIVGARTSSGLTGSSIALAIVATVIKLLAINQLPQVSRDTSRQSRLPTVGNSATVASFILLCFQQPYLPIPADLWLLASSSVLFLLRRDDVPILRDINRSNHITPPVVAGSVYLLAYIVYHSPVLLPYRHFSATLANVLEMSAVVLTLPVVVAFWVVLWFGDFHHVGFLTSRAQALSVLYCGPFFVCLIVTPIATTYHSWVYGMLGLFAGIWMWKTRIPLTLL